MSSFFIFFAPLLTLVIAVVAAFFFAPRDGSIRDRSPGLSPDWPEDPSSASSRDQARELAGGDHQR